MDQAKTPIDFLCDVGRKARIKATSSSAKAEAAANADAHLNNAGLTTYSELRAILAEIVGQEKPNRYGYDAASVALDDGWRGRARELLARTGGAA